jgi:methionine-gamma-lyase
LPKLSCPEQQQGEKMSAYDPIKAMYEVRREFGEHGGVTPSIARSSTFTVLDPGIMPEIFEGLRGPDKGGCFLYSRHFNPTVDVLSRYLAAMEGTEAAVCTASGMSAISSTLLQICRQGDEIIASHTIYGGSYALLETLLPGMGISTTFVNPTDLNAFKKAITPKTKVFYVEAMANPTLAVANLPALADLAHENGIKLVVDNTFTPLMISPMKLGADVVVHSLTKFINGASDIIGGAICGTNEFILELMDLHKGRVMLLGPTMDPRAAFDIIQRLPHLGIRVKEHSKRALAMAKHLKGLSAPVYYPGLEDHPQHQLLQSMINPEFGFGGILALDCGTTLCAERVLAILQNQERFGLIAVSLGYYDTLISCSGSSTSSEIPPEDQTSMGLSPGLVRISVGYTGRLEGQIISLEKAVKAAGVI